MAILLKINGIDYSQYVVTRKHNVQSVAEYGGTEYRDGWWKRHRTVVRHSVTGTVTLAFPNETLYNAFVEHMQSNMEAEGAYGVHVYVNNLNEVASIWAYLTPTTRTAIATKEYDYAPAHFSVTLKIEER